MFKSGEMCYFSRETGEFLGEHQSIRHRVSEEVSKHDFIYLELNRKSYQIVSFLRLCYKDNSHDTTLLTSRNPSARIYVQFL